MKEIGGYQDFEQYHGLMLHENGIKLNCGRSCLAYLIEAKKITKIWLPYFICDSVINLCRKLSVNIVFYHVGLDFKPVNVIAEGDAWVYLVNYYGQLTIEDIQFYKKRLKNIIVDNAQAYFDKPVNGIDTLYTCRKFFGVADGAVLFTDKRLEQKLQQDESFQRMLFLMGRYERTASEFYSLMLENNHRFAGEPVMRMSRLTENLLHSIDYELIKGIRTNNYRYLASKLSQINQLKLKDAEGAFAYPLMIPDAVSMRKLLIEHKVYVPTLWPNVLQQVDKDTTDYKLVQNVLPIPCDQRYGLEEMDFIVELITKC